MTDNQITAAKSGYTMTMSREAAIEAGLIDLEGDELAAEKAKRIESSTRFFREDAELRQLRGYEVTVDALLKQLGWSAAYAGHRLHPGCTCTTGYDGDSDYLCSWAEDLGFTSTSDTPAPVSAEEVAEKAAKRHAEHVAWIEQWDGKPLRIRDFFPSSFVKLDGFKDFYSGGEQ